MTTRFAIVGDKDGKKVNLFKDERTFKTLKYAKYILPRHQMAVVEHLEIIEVERLSEREKLDHAVKVNEKLEERYKIALECINAIWEDGTTQIGTQARIHECLVKLEELDANSSFKECDYCAEYFQGDRHQETCEACMTALDGDEEE